MEWYEIASAVVGIGAVLGLIIWLFMQMTLSSTEERRIKEVERMMRSQNYQSVHDYNLMIAKIFAYQKKCRSTSYAYKMLQLKIREVTIDRSRAERLGWPYATAQQLADAEKTLGVDSTTGLQALGRAHRRAQQPYDEDALKARNAPKKVLREAAERRREIRAAYNIIVKHRFS